MRVMLMTSKIVIHYVKPTLSLPFCLNLDIINECNVNDFKIDHVKPTLSLRFCLILDIINACNDFKPCN